jgi:hypothetical protein
MTTQIAVSGSRDNHNPLPGSLCGQGGCCWRALLLAALGLASAGIGWGQGVFNPDPDPARTNTPPQLWALPRASDGWVRLHGDFYESNAPPAVLTVQVSTDLAHWRDAATLLVTPFDYVDPGSAGDPVRFYRLAVAPWSVTNDWSNVLSFPWDPLMTASECSTLAALAWVKFTLVLDEPHRVYFQDSRLYPLHYTFATTRLSALAGLSPREFEAVTLHRNGQRAVLGVLYMPRTGIAGSASAAAAFGQEFAIQFIGADPYPAGQIADWFKIVQSAVGAGPGVTAFYFPSFEQQDSAFAQRSAFESRGIPLAAVERWVNAQTTVYAPGWAAGRLVFVPGAEITAAYADGRLSPTDILLTDAVPAEVPFVAGILSLRAATPASHVAILAQNYGVPFVYLADVAEQQRVKAIAGRFVAVRTGARLTDGEVKVLDLDAELDDAGQRTLAGLKTPGFRLRPKARYGAWFAAVASLEPSDLRFFGGKASNFGLLRRVIPEYSPDAIAVSFDLWDDFLDQDLPGGTTLRQTIHDRLGTFRYPPDVAVVRAELASLRNLIRHTARFTPAQEQAILDALAGFDPARRLRCRSSTNVEDSESFTGAGLYDSYSGCLTDDLDGNDAGPSACDPTEPEERGVFRALRRVYASFYNENAFLERLRLGVNESDAGMAVLIHYSAPDEEELANGVITLTATVGSAYAAGRIVTQPGAASVTNPDTTASPEITEFNVYAGPWGLTNIVLRQGAALVPIGGSVMNWLEDYEQLAGLASQVARSYQPTDTNQTRFALDLEFKKLQPGRLQIKQVRELPLPDTTRRLPAFLANEPSDWLVAPGDSQIYAGPLSFPSNVLALHRLKSRWHLVTTNQLLTSDERRASIYRSASVEFADGPQRRTLSGAPAGWPDASFALLPGTNPESWWTLDRWSHGAGQVRRDLALVTALSSTVAAGDSQWQTLGDERPVLSVNYAIPMPSLTPSGTTLPTTNEAVFLFPARSPSSRTTNDIEAGPVRILTDLELISYLDPTPSRAGGCNGDQVIDISPFGLVSGSGTTRITGLLAEPLTLRDPYAQTLWIHGRQGHETITELVLDPWLEPGLSQQAMADLTARNVRLVYCFSFHFGQTEQWIAVLGLDNQWRRLANQSDQTP